MNGANNRYDRVVIKLDEFGKGSVAVNGQELKSTMGVSMDARGGEITSVTIQFLASVEMDVLVDGVEKRYAQSIDPSWQHNPIEEYS